MDVKWYVYELIDPQDGSVFYVGKGSGSRMYDHGKDDVNKAKQERISLIGYENVVRVKIAEFWDERAAYDCEEDRISMYAGLTNISKVSYKLRKPKKKYVYFFDLVFNLIRGKDIEASMAKLDKHFPRKSLISQEHVKLFDIATMAYSKYQV